MMPVGMASFASASASMRCRSMPVGIDRPIVSFVLQAPVFMRHVADIASMRLLAAFVSFRRLGQKSVDALTRQAGRDPRGSRCVDPHATCGSHR